jgi:osmoprotectant transport system ATP-binding protein
MIEFKNVSKRYKNTSVIENLNLKINEGELVVLIGPSGSGKTTTLKMINQLIKTTGGELLINGVNILEQDPVLLRRNIGYVIQHVGLIPHLTIEENIGVVPHLKKWSKEAIHERARELLSLVHLDPDEFMQRYPGELSGGQKQRVGIARAFAAKPDLILMDEPFSALDPITRSALQNEVIEIQRELKKTIVFVTHDMDEALELGDRICIMNEGKIVQFDTPENILLNPINEFVEDFIGKDRIANRPDLVKAQDIMIKNPITIGARRIVIQAIELMRSKQVDTLVVVNQKHEYKGVVRLKDLRLKDGSKELSHILDTNLLPAKQEDNLIEIFNRIKDDYQSLPILDDGNKLVGLITKTKLLAVLTNQYIEEEEVKHA